MGTLREAWGFVFNPFIIFMVAKLWTVSIDRAGEDSKGCDEDKIMG